MKTPTILSNLTFCGHLAIICHMAGAVAENAEDTSNERVFYQASKKYLDVCDRQRVRLGNYAMQYHICNVRDILRDPKLRFPPVPDETLASAIRKCLDKTNGETLVDRMKPALRKHLDDEQWTRLAEEICKRALPPKHLLTPFSTVSFGHTDNLSIMLADEFDYAAWTLEAPDVPVRQTCVSFCPELKRVGIETDEGSPFFEMQDLLSSYVRDPDRKGWEGLPRFEKWKDKPLVGVTYFRTSGLCNLGSGLLWQEAILRETARRIRDLLGRLKQTTFDPRLAVPDDFSRFRCSFLWPIGWSDFCLVSLASNYSVIKTIVHDLRQMTFQNLFDVMHGVYGRNAIGEDISLEAMAAEFSVLEGLVKQENTKRSNHPDGQTPPLDARSNLFRHNHVFCSSATTLAVEHHAFMGIPTQEMNPWNGVVSADPRFNVPPGHMASLAYKDLQVGAKQFHEPPANKKQVDVKRWVASGHYDSSDKSFFAPHVRCVHPLTQLFNRVRQLRGENSSPDPYGSAWPILDLFTEIHVPLLLFAPAKPDHTEHVNMESSLSEIRRRVFRESGTRSELSLELLKKCTRDLQIPLPLWSAIIDLYVDYSRSLGDPFLFDNVLDLYDVFRATYRVLTREMPGQLGQLLEKCNGDEALRESRRMAFMDENRIREITALVNLMENALQRRTQMGFRQAQRSQEALDMRGGFNRLINAADVPLKCGFSILRQIMLGHVESIYGRDDLKAGDIHDTRAWHDFRARLGGASKIAHNSTAVVRRFNLGNTRTNFIADLGLNIAHLTRPGFLVTHLHETGHLLCDLVRIGDPQDAKPQEYRPGICSRCMNKYGRFCFRFRPGGQLSDWDMEIKERHEEIFAEMFTFGLLWHDVEKDGFAQTYLRFYLGMFFLNERGMNMRSEVALRRFSEVAIRGFMAVDPWLLDREERTGATENIYHPDAGDLLTVEVFDKARGRFVELMKQAGPMHFEFRRFWKGSNRKYIEDKFGQLYHETFRPLCCIWHDVSTIVKRVCEPLSPDGDYGTNPRPAELAEILDQFEEGYREGKPIARFLHTYSDWLELDEGDREKRHAEGEKRKHLDSVFVMRHILRTHIEDLFKDMTVERETCRSLAMDVSKGMNRQLLDRGYNGLVSADFVRREEYLKRRASVLMTLWDLSTAIRGRILDRILKAHFPDRPDSQEIGK